MYNMLRIKENSDNSRCHQQVRNASGTTLRTIAMSVLLAVATTSAAQSTGNRHARKPKAAATATTQTYTYTGPRIQIGHHPYRCSLMGTVKGMTGEGFQGMAVHGNYVVSLQNSGICNISTYDGNTLKQLATYKLASNNRVNHSNVAAFGTEKADAADPMPVLYVSQAAREPYNGRKDVCFVERLGMDKSTTVQTIYLDDADKIFGYALQWTVDRFNNLLIGYGNTVNNDAPDNRHAVIIFRLPKLSEGRDVTLRREQAIDFFYIEDSHNVNLNPLIGQGLCVSNDRLFMPTGFGTAERPSIMYVVGLTTHRLENAIDMTRSTKNELEDCDVYNDEYILLQTVKGDIYRVEFQ